MEPAQRKTWRVLSIDGGGMRGVIPAMVLIELERRTGRRIWELFDFFTGTSTGSLVALTLLTPDANGDARHSAVDLLELYEKEGPFIFETAANSSAFRRFLNTAARAVFGGPRYKSTGLEAALSKTYGDARLHDALKPVIIPTSDLTNCMPYFFRSWDSIDGHYFMRDVGRASSSGPTYFPPYLDKKSSGTRILVDGGIAANNPTACALAEVRRYAMPDDDFFVVSLGTGTTLNTNLVDPSKIGRWRDIQWLMPLVELFWTSCSQVVDYQMKHEFNIDPNNRRYYRFDTVLDSDLYRQDDATRDHIAKLKLVGRKLVEVEQSADFDDVANRLADLAGQERFERRAIIGINRLR